jgi:hypothetical protein
LVFLGIFSKNIAIFKNAAQSYHRHNAKSYQKIGKISFFARLIAQPAEKLRE